MQMVPASKITKRAGQKSKGKKGKGSPAIFRYGLILIDGFSRKLYGRLLMTKGANEVRAGFLSIFKEAGQLPQEIG